MAGAPPAKVAAIIREGAIDDVKHDPVRTLVNKPGIEGPELIELRDLAAPSAG
jgi:hypothetical protein